MSKAHKPRKDSADNASFAFFSRNFRPEAGHIYMLAKRALELGKTSPARAVWFHNELQRKWMAALYGAVNGGGFEIISDVCKLVDEGASVTAPVNRLEWFLLEKLGHLLGGVPTAIDDTELSKLYNKEVARGGNGRVGPREVAKARRRLKLPGVGKGRPKGKPSTAR